MHRPSEKLFCCWAWLPAWLLTGLGPAAAARAEMTSTQPSDRMPEPFPTSAPADQPALRRFAVLPFRPDRPGRDPDWIGPGLAETVDRHLNGIVGFLACEWTRDDWARQTPIYARAGLGDIPAAVAVGKMLAAERLLVGSYGLSDGRVTFKVGVVDVMSGLVVRTATVEVAEAKLFDAAQPLVEAVVRSFDKTVITKDGRPALAETPAALRITLTPRQLRQLQQYGRVGPEAYEALCRGVAASDKADKIKWFTKSIELDPDNVLAYALRGDARMVAGDNDASLRDYENVLQLDPQCAQAHNQLHVLYMFKKDYERCIEECTRAIELRPGFALAYSNRAAGYDSIRKFDEAIADCTRAVELDPNVGIAYANRAYARFFKDDFDNAWADVKLCQRVEPALKIDFILDRLRAATGRKE